MAEQWYLERDGSEYGPYSAEHVKKLATLGRLRPTDVIRSAGMEKGVAAARVKGLLSTSEAAAPPPSPSPDTGGGKGWASQPAPAAESPVQLVVSEAVPSHEPGPPEIAEAPATEASTTPVQPSNEQVAKAKVADPKKQDVRKRRAVALANAVILSQDGVSVQFRKKCGTCGHEDSVRTSMIIAIGIARAGFFCPKCRKRRPVQIQGIG